jgi:hypothetical protein
VPVNDRMLLPSVSVSVVSSDVALAARAARANACSFTLDLPRNLLRPEALVTYAVDYEDDVGHAVVGLGRQDVGHELARHRFHCNDLRVFGQRELKAFSSRRAPAPFLGLPSPPS